MLNKGLPQGSILGPNMWNMALDELLLEMVEDDYGVVAYEDDLLVLATGDSRREIKDCGQRVTDRISAWCRKEGLQISSTKTEMIIIKERKNIGGKQKASSYHGTRRQITKGSISGASSTSATRKPIIKLGNRTSIKLAQEVPYLGITFGTCLSLIPHLNHTEAKTKRLFNR